MGIKRGMSLGFIVYFLIVVALIFALLDDLNLMDLTSRSNLEDFSRTYFLEEGLSKSEQDLQLVHREDLAYSSLLIFQSQDSYLASYFIKGRLTNFYNFKSAYSYQDLLPGDLVNLELADSVYEYSLELGLSRQGIYSQEVFRSLKMDFAGIILILIFLLASIFLYRKKRATTSKIRSSLE